jgi:hypothetical protein
MEECKKRRLLLQSAREDVFAVVQKHIEKIPISNKTKKAVYQQRLVLCIMCDNLLSGTCLKCGCYVELRAAFSNQKYLDTKHKKW